MASKNTPFIPAFCDGKMSIKGTHYYFLAKQKHCCCLLSHGVFCRFLSKSFGYNIVGLVNSISNLLSFPSACGRAELLRTEISGLFLFFTVIWIIFGSLGFLTNFDDFFDEFFLTSFFDECLWRIFWRILIIWKIFFTYNILTITSFRIGVLLDLFIDINYQERNQSRGKIPSWSNLGLGAKN